jgi:hypothetical protein
MTGRGGAPLDSLAGEETQAPSTGTTGQGAPVGADDGRLGWPGEPADGTGLGWPGDLP